jgi:hypothetical protein
MSQSSSDSYRNTLRYQGQDYRFAPSYLRKRDPIAPTNASPDIKPAEQQGYYPVSSLWTNTVGNRVWLLVNIQNNLANWVNISNGGGGGAGIQSLSAPNMVVFPDGAGNIAFTSPDASLTITGVAGGLQLSALPVLNALTFGLPGGNTVTPTNGVVNLTTDGSVSITKADANTINLSVMGGVGDVVGLIAGNGAATGPGTTVNPNVGGRITFDSNNVTAYWEPVPGPGGTTISLNTVGVLSKLLFITDVFGGTGIPEVLNGPDYTSARFAILGTGGIQTTSTTNGLVIDGTGATTALIIHTPDNANVSPNAATKTINFTSANNSVGITGNAGANTVDFNALPVLVNNFRININGVTSIAPDVTGKFFFTASGGTTITNPAANTINFNSAGGGGGAVNTLTGNTGGAQNPTGGNFNIVTANSTVVFNSTAGQLTEDFGITNLILGSSALGITTATHNVGLGQLSLSSIVTGASNTCTGYNSGHSINTGNANTCLGLNAAMSANSSSNNTCVGSGSLSALTNAVGSNTAVGQGAMNSLITGSYNTCLGSTAGSALTTNESSNVLIGNVGVAGDMNTIRLGSLNAGNGNLQQNRAFCTGISGVTVAGSSAVVVAPSGQLSSVVSGAAGTVLTSAGPGVSPIWAAAGGGAGGIQQLSFTGATGSVPMSGAWYYTYAGGGPAGGFFTTLNISDQLYNAQPATVTAVYISFTCQTFGSFEPSSFYVVVNGVQVAAVATGILFNAFTFAFSNTTLAVPLAVTDKVALVWNRPAWTVAPSNCNSTATMVLKY